MQETYSFVATSNELPFCSAVAGQVHTYPVLVLPSSAWLELFLLLWVFSWTNKYSYVIDSVLSIGAVVILLSVKPATLILLHVVKPTGF